MPPISIRFADCELDLAGYELRRGGRPCAVEPQVFDLLVHLASNAARLVTKDELIARIWGGRIVSDAALSSRIKSARRAIGDDGEQQRLIRTVHGRGFRFVAAVAPSVAPASAAPDLTVSAQDAAAIPAAASSAAAIRPHPASGRPTIAVRPLRPGSAGDADRALAESVTEDIVTCLARDRTLAVASEPDPLAGPGSAAGRAPGYVLEGRVRRAGDRLIVTVRLTDAIDALHIWAERCEQPLAPRMAVEDRIARRVSAMVRGEIEAAEARRAAAAAEHERGAWAHYHLGLTELYRFTPSGLAAAQAHFARALAIDPAFASARARLAYVHIQEYWYGPGDRRALALDLALTEAARAVGLDHKNALGHFALGRVHALRHEFDLAMPAFETAIRLNPGFAQAYFAFGQAHFYAGRPREAVRLLETAIEVDPNDPHLWSFLHDQSDAYYALGELEEAERRTRAASRRPNATHWPFASLASVLGTAGRIAEAREALGQLRARSPQYTLSAARADLAHFSSRDYVDRFVEGLRVAGLSDA